MYLGKDSIELELQVELLHQLLVLKVDYGKLVQRVWPGSHKDAQ